MVLGHGPEIVPYLHSISFDSFSFRSDPKNEARSFFGICSANPATEDTDAPFSITKCYI